MKWNKIYDLETIEFKKGWKIYEAAFPEDERRDLKQQAHINQNIEYNFYNIEINNEIVAIIADWKFDDFIFVEHLAVRKDKRGQGLGTELLNSYLSSIDKTIVLEVERPEDIDSKRRIKFYENLGLKLNLHDYIQPPYAKDKNSLPMYIMSFPNKIDQNTFFKIRDNVYSKVYQVK